MDTDSEHEGRRPHKGAPSTEIQTIHGAIKPSRRTGQTVNAGQAINAKTAYPGGVC